MLKHSRVSSVTKGPLETSRLTPLDDKKEGSERYPPPSPIEQNEASPIPKAIKKKFLNNLKEGLLWQKRG